MTGGEVPVQGADAHAGPAGHVLQGGVRAAFREGGAGYGEQAVVVAPRIGPEGPDPNPRFPIHAPSMPPAPIRGRRGRPPPRPFPL
ncbi:hypothetical protein GCM10010388_33130 [Streptomyces mauvecolor]